MGFYYLLDSPNPNYTQCRATRRGGNRPSGVVVVHTAENVTDLIGADAGAEGVARFIGTRTTPGSYHVLCDSDSTVYLAPWSYECWHDTRTNPHSVGISGAVASAGWKSFGDRGDRIVRRMAIAAREYAAWLKRNYGIIIPARRITQAQAMAKVPGFVAHGTMDPGRRSDPGRDFNWDLFFEVFSTGVDQPEASKPPTEEEELMGVQDIIIGRINAYVDARVEQETSELRAALPKTIAYQIPGGTRAWFEPIMGGLRRWIPGHEGHMFRAVPLSIGNEFWRRPVDGYLFGEGYRVTNHPTIHPHTIHVLEAGVLRAVSGPEEWAWLNDVHRAQQATGIGFVDLPADHPIWELLPKEQAPSTPEETIA